MSTCRNNSFETDECFMNLECRFKWEKEIAEGNDYVGIIKKVWNYSEY